MTFIQWKKELKKQLRPLPKNEVSAIIDYYDEMYTDKAEAGLCADEILAEFGTPIECAEKIRGENENGSDNSYTAVYTDEKKAPPHPRSPLAVRITAYTFLTLFIIIPFAAVLVSAIAAFGASTIACSALILIGPAAIIMGIFYLFTGGGIGASLALLGGGIAVIGICTALAICFYIITKYTAIASYKLLVYIYMGKRG